MQLTCQSVLRNRGGISFYVIDRKQIRLQGDEWTFGPELLGKAAGEKFPRSVRVIPRPADWRIRAVVPCFMNVGHAFGCELGLIHENLLFCPLVRFHNPLETFGSNRFVPSLINAWRKKRKDAVLREGFRG